MDVGAPHGSPSPAPARRGVAAVSGALFVAGCACVAVLASDPCGGGTSPRALNALVGFATLVVGLIAVERSRHRLLAGGAAVVTVLGLAAALRAELPFSIGWAASRAAFDAHVAAGPAPDGARRIGWFRVEEEEVSSDHVRWFHFAAKGECTACGICLGCGVAWWPPGVDPSPTEEGLRPIGGRWYAFKHCT